MRDPLARQIMTDTFASGFATPGIHPVLINPLPIRALKRLPFRSRRKKQHQQTPGATKKVNFTLFEIAGLLVGFDHIACHIVNADQSILAHAKVDLRRLRSVFPWRLCYCSRPQASVLLGFAKA